MGVVFEVHADFRLFHLANFDSIEGTDFLLRLLFLFNVFGFIVDLQSLVVWVYNSFYGGEFARLLSFAHFDSNFNN